jgi:polyphosphate glucokinase
MGIVGIDIGGSGIKAGVVDSERGELVGERLRIATPDPASPDAVARATAELVDGLAPGAPVGIGFPAVVCDGTTLTAANVDPAWIGMAAEDLFSTALGRPCAMVNDADAAGLAEVRFGAGRGVGGVVLVLTLGTGIGSALFVNGALVPNTELGHLELHGVDAETRAAASARKREGLSWESWARRLDAYLAHVEALFWPDLVILGGGVSKQPERFLPLLTPRRATVVAASLGNRAGVVGAALFAWERGLASTSPAPARRRGARAAS